MPRPLAAGVIFTGLLAGLVGADAASACTVIDDGPFQLVADAPHGTAPRPVRITGISIIRGFCDDIGSLTIRLGHPWADAYGYRLAVAAGTPPPGLEFRDEPYASDDDEVTVIWVDADADLRRTFHFVLAITVVDEAGRESQVHGVGITVGAYRRRPPPPPRSTLPPMLWIGGLTALFGAGALAGRLRRPRCPPG